MVYPQPQVTFSAIGMISTVFLQFGQEYLVIFPLTFVFRGLNFSYHWNVGFIYIFYYVLIYIFDWGMLFVQKSDDPKVPLVPLFNKGVETQYPYWNLGVSQRELGRIEAQNKGTNSVTLLT